MQTIYGIRYIDDVVCRRVDHDADGAYDDVGSKTFYHLTDNQFSTVAVLDQNATLLERISYDPYGRARHHWRGDIDGDGDADSTDRAIITTLHNAAITSVNYNVDADLDRDGEVNTRTTGDGGAWDNEGALAALVPGVLSSGGSGGVGNIFGFSGYVHNAEIAGGGGLGEDRAGIYTVRFRHYDVGLGRWLERDPMGYVDGMNMVEYVRGMPLRAMDPTGLIFNLGTGFAGGVIGGVIGAGSALVFGGDPLQGFASGFVGGFVAGFTFHPQLGWVAAGGISGLLGGFAGGITDQAINRYIRGMAWDWNAVIRDTALGGMLGAAGGWLYKYIKGLFGGGNRLAFMDDGIGGPKAYAPPSGAKGGGCFVAGTLVCAASGLIPIEQIQAGQQLWSYDQAQSEWVLEEVVDTHKREYDGDLVTLRLELSDKSFEEIVCTGNHPFWVVSGDRLDERPAVAELLLEDQIAKSVGRWTEARWLRLGDKFLTRTGVSATVVGLTIRLERVKVYNLQVNRLQLYAVGSAGVLVHNSGPALRPDVSPLSGGRGGGRVKGLTGPPNSVIKGSPGRIFITDENGRVIWDITRDRAKPVVPGQGFGDKQVPTAEQLDCINRMWPTP